MSNLPFIQYFIRQSRPYWELMRFHKPIGILLLLWPTWWALWLAAGGFPKLDVLIIFTLGVVIMRAAGCVINDIADRKFDRHVSRTQQRPLATGALSLHQAGITFTVLLLMAFLLVLLTNFLTILLSFVAVALASLYPWMKRYTYLPQVVLGAAFAMSIPMAFAAQTGTLIPEVVIIYVTSLVWTVIYDTFYGMVDREHDKRIGVKSTAILFEDNEAVIIAGLQLLVVAGLMLIGQRFELGWFFYLAVAISSAMMLYHQTLLRQRQANAYFEAFHHNHWIGVVIFLGIGLDYYF